MLRGVPIANKSTFFLSGCLAAINTEQLVSMIEKIITVMNLFIVMNFPLEITASNTAVCVA
jgi:hypothetical protein